MLCDIDVNSYIRAKFQNYCFCTKKFMLCRFRDTCNRPQPLLQIQRKVYHNNPVMICSGVWFLQNCTLMWQMILGMKMKIYNFHTVFFLISCFGIFPLNQFLENLFDCGRWNHSTILKNGKEWKWNNFWFFYGIFELEYINT